MKKIILGFLVIVSVLTGCATEQAYRPASPPPPGEFIRAQGIGKAPKDATSPEQAMLLAREMAKTDAMNKLREKVQTLPVRGGLSVEQCISRKPSLRPGVEEVIQGARVISEHQDANGFWVEISIRYADLKSACQ